MKIDIGVKSLKNYTEAQLNTFFPDKFKIDLHQFPAEFDLCLQRLERCYSVVKHTRYKSDNNTLFNHLYSDHYLMYIWFLSNTIWKETGNVNLASKLYYLNKTLHGFDCMYDTSLPEIFLIFHGVGTMLGKAHYEDYFIAFQGCTVGSHKGNYPFIGKGVTITANSAIIGNCTIGDRVTISAYTSIFETNIPKDSAAIISRNSGRLEYKTTKECFAQQFFTTDLIAI